MRQRYFDIIFIAAMVVLSLMARIALLPLESVDWEGPVSGWVHRIQELGAWNSLGVAVSDYTSSYMYVLCLISGFSNSLVATKAASIVFDYAAAFVIFLLIKQLTGNRWKSIMASAIFLFCPTILINSAWWMYSQKFRMTGEILVTMALFSVSLALFTLPHMHERYGFIVDMLAIIYAVQRPSKTPIAIGYITVSLLSYMWFLHSAILIPHIYLAAALMVLNALVCMDLAKQIKENPS